jgi:poly-gamma-glutamate synthesis protein (capsule biosynthesis protein)
VSGAVEMNSRAWVLAVALLGCRGRPSPDAAMGLDVPRVDVVAEAAVEAPVDVPVDVPAPSRRVVVTLSGDLMLHRGVLDHFDDHAAQGGLAWSLQWIASLVAPREVALTWLDSPLTDAFRPPFAGAPGALGTTRAIGRSVARDLARIGIDGVCLATHHAYDQMGDGLTETAAALRGAGLGVAGAGDSEEAAWSAWVTEREGMRVAFLCFTQRVQMAPGRNGTHATVAQSIDGARAVAAITAARAQADVVVAGVQWNRAPFRPLGEDQRALARQLVEAGADVVVGTGVVTQARLELVSSPRGDAVVAWSMGSLLSNYGAQWRGLANPSPAIERVLVDPATRDVALMRAQFERMDDGRLSLVTLTANALWMQHGEEGVRVVPLRLLETDLRRARARAVGETLGTAVRVRE